MKKIKIIRAWVVLKLHALLAKLKAKYIPEAEHTFDTIVADFHGAVSKLTVLARKHSASASAKQAQIETLKVEIEQHDTEADRASAVASKLRDLVS